MVGFICYGLLGASMFASGNWMWGCAMLVTGAVWLQMDGDEEE